MTRETTDILISGGGVAGLIAAAAFGQAGFSVLCVDPTAPVTEAGAAGADHRSTAFMQPAIDLLDAAGLWARLAPHAAALRVMRIIDAGGETPVARLSHSFEAGDLGTDAFGFNLPNWLLRRELLAHLGSLPGVRFRPGVATVDVLPRDAQALVTLSDGTRVAARLLVAADGRASPLRERLGIGLRQWRYGQKALAFTVTHPQPHDQVTTEVHRSGGPFTLVPLRDIDGRPASAAIWMERGPEVARLAALPPADFAAEATDRACAVFGPLRLAGPRAVWPIISQIADRFDGPRCALIAEAAHVVPPIGAQGLNMSLADLAVLLELAQAAPGDPGSPAMLASYQRRRWVDARLRVAGIDLLNRASMAAAPPLRDLRAGALDALYRVTPLRRAVMRAGMGAGGMGSGGMAGELAGGLSGAAAAPGQGDTGSAAG